MNAIKSKTLAFERVRISQNVISLCSEELKAVDNFKYLGVMFSEDDSRKVENKSRVTQGRRIGSAMKALLNGKNLHVDFLRNLHEVILVPARIYRCETQVYISQNR